MRQFLVRLSHGNKFTQLRLLNYIRPQRATDRLRQIILINWQGILILIVFRLLLKGFQ
jgi:hypothetical protein